VTAIGPWLLVVASGIYHGANPAMGWPLAVSAGLMGRGRRDLVAALGPLALGHALAVAGLLLPFSLLTILVQWGRQIRIGAAVLVMAFGLWLLVRRGHPRFLARIRPAQLALWSFAVAIAHGAGLMLLPIYIGLCSPRGLDPSHRAAAYLVGHNLAMALAVSAVHTTAMILTGGVMALAAYAWIGMRFISRSWFNLDALWAASLLAVGAAALGFALSDAA
jgi:hypothetical protein